MRRQALTPARLLSVAMTLLLATGAVHAAGAAAADAADAGDAGDAAGIEKSCELSYRITPRYDTTPRRLDVTLSFPAAGRRETALSIQSGWAGIKDYGPSLTLASDADAGVRVQPGDDANRWKVEHGPDGRVTLRYQVRAALADPDDGKVQSQDQLYRTQIGADWFQFFGYGALLIVDGRVDGHVDDGVNRMCLSVTQPDGQVGPLVGTFFDGTASASADVHRSGPHSMLRHAFYGGGPGWRVIHRPLASGLVVIASRGKQAIDDTRFANQTERLLETHRRFWGDKLSPTQTVARTPNNSKGSNGGTLVAQAAVLHVSQDPVTSNDSFEFLIGNENLHLWLPNRLGPRPRESADQAPRHYWLSEGFTDYYTHRLLLSGGLWSLDRYAAKLTQMLQGYWRSPARNATAESIAPRFHTDNRAGRQMYMRGELLAMGWDRELRRTDADGLDALLRGLMLSSPDAVDSKTAVPAHERVLTALTKALGDRPREQVRRQVDEGRSFDLDEGLAGPCFQLSWADVPRWVPGFDMAAMSTYKAAGVVVDGPAYRAGLRDGMSLQGWSIVGDDTTKEIMLKIKTEDGSKELRYLPVDGSSDRLPSLTVKPGAASDAACRGWIRP